GTLSVRWMTAGVPWQVISGPSLYSRTALDRARTSYVRFLKAASLGAGLSITANEVAYLDSNVDLRVAGQGWLNQLSAAGLPDVVTGSALSGVLSALLEFARIKAALSPADESFLAVLRNPDVTLGGGGSALLALTQWDQSSLSALLMHYFGDTKTAPLGRLEAFCRVYDAYAMVTTCGISASALVRTTNNPTPADASNLRSALRARYADADWLTLVKPINDTMRARQRDALVAFALHHHAEHRHARSTLRVHAHGCRDGAVWTDIARSPRAVVDSALHRACAAQPRARDRSDPHLGGPVGVDEALPSLASEPRGVPLAGELARSGAARRSVAHLQGHDGRTPSG